jgi:uncharacterized damage-inducible protein DinB
MPTTLPPDTLRELMRHMEWADAAVWRALLPCAPARQDPRLRVLLQHLHGVQRGFLAIWIGEPLAVHPASQHQDLPELQSAVRAYYATVHDALAAFSEASLQRPVAMPGLDPYEKQMGRRFEAPTLAETVLQVTSHSTYHRGQVNARLREVGGEPPLVDYIAWIWFGRPAAEWTTAE